MFLDGPELKDVINNGCKNHWSLVQLWPKLKKYIYCTAYCEIIRGSCQFAILRVAPEKQKFNKQLAFIGGHKNNS